MDIHNELVDVPILKSLKNRELWEVPNDYFESFADKFMEKLEREEMNPEKAFSDIPSDYFETFLDRCKDKLAEEELFVNAPVLSNVPKITQFQDIPENYFENLTENIHFAIEKEDLQNSAPILFSLPKKMPYSDIPADYFEHSSANIQARIKENAQKTAAKRLSFFAGKYAKTWVSLAAMMVMILGGTFLFQHFQVPKGEKQELSFAHISNAELAVASEVVDEFDVNTLVEELQLNTDEAVDLEGISDEELSKYLNDIDVSDI